VRGRDFRDGARRNDRDYVVEHSRAVFLGRPDGLGNPILQDPPSFLDVAPVRPTRQRGQSSLLARRPNGWSVSNAKKK
jgi:hypothetical protein